MFVGKSFIVHAVQDKRLNCSTEQIDPLGRKTTFVYDNLYRRKIVTLPDPDGSGGSDVSPVWNYAFDNRTLLESVTDPLTRLTAYGYDNAGRTTGVTLPDPDGGGSAQASSVYGYEFDALTQIKGVRLLWRRSKAQIKDCHGLTDGCFDL